MWGAGRPAARWAGPDVALPASGCGTERRAGCCDGRGGADPLGSAGRHKHEDVYGGTGGCACDFGLFVSNQCDQDDLWERCSGSGRT